MPTVDIYCRCATDEDAARRFREQEAACRAYCEVHGLPVGQVMHEIAPGIAYKGRPKFDLIRARYQNHLIDGLIVSDIERLTRRPEQLFSLLEELDQYGVTLYCVLMNPAEHFWVSYYRETR